MNRQRTDAAHAAGQEPHIAPRPTEHQLREIRNLLLSSQCNIREAADSIGKFPELRRILLDRAASLLMQTHREVVDVRHAAAILGIDRLAGIIDQYAYRTFRKTVSEFLSSSSESIAG